MVPSTTAFATILATYPPAVQSVAVALRKLVFETLPDPLEMIDVPRKLAGYGYGPRYVDIVCTLILSKGGVKLGLAYGASLPDPRSLLAGTGKVHRHVNFTSVADIDRPGVKPLLKAALAAQRRRALATQEGHRIPARRDGDVRPAGAGQRNARRLRRKGSRS